MRKLVLALVVAVALGAAVPALGQAPAVQEAVFGYLARIPNDYNVIAAASLKTRLDAGEKIFLLDVREPNEFADGRIPGAVNIPIRLIGQNMDKLPARTPPSSSSAAQQSGRPMSRWPCRWSATPT